MYSHEVHDTEEWVQPYVPEVPRRPPKPDENYGEIIPEEEIEEEIENIKRQAEEFHAKDYGEEFLPPDATRLLARLGEPNDSKKPGVQRWKRLDWEHKKCTPEEIDIIQTHMLIKGKHTKVLTVLNVEGSISARDANGAHLGLRLLETIFTDGALPNLRELNVGSNDINDQEGARLVKAIRTSNCTHEFSILDMPNNEIADETAAVLSEGQLPELKMLHIAHNRITDEGAKAFANSKFSQLDRLEIEDNLLSDEGFEILGESFATGELSKVHYTIVDSFHFSCHDLRNSSNTLRVGGAIDRLNLAGVSDQGHRHIKGGRISDNDMLFFAQFLIVPKRLRKLDLLFLHTNIIGAGGCAALASAMRAGTSEGLTNLGQLHLTNNPIGDMGLKQLAGPIEHNQALPKLRELHMGRCHIGDKGLVRFATALGAGGLPSVELLSLGQNNIGNDGCIALAQALVDNGFPKLKGLYLGVNSIGDEGLESLSAALVKDQVMPKLTQLHLFKNPWTIEGGKAKVEQAVTLTKREKLVVDFD